MQNVLTAIDETGSTVLYQKLAVALGTVTTSGTGSLGPFPLSYTLNATLAPGQVDLNPPNVIRILPLKVHWSLNALIKIDLNQLLPPIYLPHVKITITWKKWQIKITISVTWVHYPWPVLQVPLNVSDDVSAIANLRLIVRSDAANWYVYGRVVALPSFGFGPATASIIGALALILPALLLPIPLIGGLAAIATFAILGAITVGGVTGLLGPALTPLIAGREFMFYQRPRLLPLLPSQGPNDPAVNLSIDMVEASIVNSGEDELRIYVTIGD